VDNCEFYPQVVITSCPDYELTCKGDNSADILENNRELSGIAGKFGWMTGDFGR
jgi:hypothetical protein